jgi:fibronectin-binding autotransporter adhesin
MFPSLRIPVCSHVQKWCAAVLACALISVANAQLVSINETFTGASFTGTPWLMGGSNFAPKLTAQAGIDAPGNGWLRLTDAGGDEATYAYNPTSFNGQNATIAVKFNYAAYGGTGADGITFFLADASKTFGVGAYGGSLGYAQKTAAAAGIPADIGGMSGGYIGLGIDEFGNYSNPSEGRIGGTGFQSPNVSIRGPGSGVNGYDFLGGTGVLDTPIAFAGGTRPTGINERVFQVVITATNQLTVYMQAGATGSMESLYSVDLSGYARPDNLIMGFTGSTGGSTNIHEIRGLALTSVEARLWTNSGATNTWGSSSNWNGSSGVIPAVGSDILFDNHYVSSAQTIDVGATRSIRSLQIDAPFSYTLNNGTLQFNDQGVLGPSGIFVSQGHGAATHTINSAIIADNAIEIRNNSTGALNLTSTLTNGGNDLALTGSGTTTISGVVSGAGGMVKKDSGVAILSGNNTSYSGTTQLKAGTLTVGNNNALGTGSLAISGGTLSSNASNTIANAITLTGSGALTNIQTGGALTQSGGNHTFTLSNATQSGTVNLSESNTGRTLTVAVNGAASTISGIIQNGGTGAGSFTKTGVGTLTLSGANTYTGTTTINGGTISLGGNDRLADASSLNIGALGALNLAGFSEKVGTLTAAGGATINFGSTPGANTFVFGTYVAPASGVLVISNWEAPVANVAVDQLATTVAGQNVSTIYISGYGVASEAATATSLGGTYGTGYLLTPVAAVLKEWDGSTSTAWGTSANWTAVNEPGATEIAYFNTLGAGRTNPILSANRTIAGIRFGSGASAYTLGVSGSRTLTLSGAVPYIQQQSANAQTISITTVALGSSTVADITGAGNLTINSVISGTGKALIKDGTGSGKLILSGVNTFTGGLYVNNGTAQANNNAALGTGAATIANGATLEISGGRSITNNVSVNGSGVGVAGAIQSVNGINTLSGTITETGTSTFGADVGTTLNLTGLLTGVNVDTTLAGAGNFGVAQITTGTGGVILNGTGTTTFNGTTNANTYTGTTVVNSGTLILGKTAGTTAVAGNLQIGDGAGAANSATVQLNAANQISNSSALTIGTDGLLNLNGQAETIGSLSGTGNINNSNATATTLTMGDTTSTTYSGLIQDTGGNLSLVKQGAGKLTLSGANSFAGTTSLNAGILAIQNNTALGSGVATVASGANLEVAGNLTNVANAFNLNGPGTLANDGAIQSTSGSNTISGALTLQSASRIMADAGSTLTLSGAISGTGMALTLGGSGNITVTGNITTGAAGTLIKDGDGYVILNQAGASTYTGATTVSAGTLEIRRATSLGTSAGGATVASGATLAVSGSITTAETLALSGQGVGSAGALRSLSGANILSGNIALNAPTYVGVDAGTLTASGVLSGAAGYDLTKVGAGTLTLSGAAANTFAGAFNVSDGTVILNKTAGVDAVGNGTGAVVIGDSLGAANSATLQLAANNQINNLSTVTINSDGRLDVNSRTEQLGAIAGSGSIALGSGNTLTVGNATSTTFSGAVSTTGTGAITKTGAGTLTLAETAGSNSFAAATLNLTQGTVQLGASNILNTALNFNGGTFSVNGFSDTVSSATLTASSFLDFNSLAGVFDFTNGLYSGGTLTINNWAGSISGGGASQLRLPGTVTGALLANINFAGYGNGAQIVNGEIVPITGTSYSWNVTGAGTWVTDANWTPDPTGTGIGPNGTGTSVVFGSALTTDSSVTVAGTKTVGYMTFNDNNRYTITGGVIGLDVATGSTQINVSNSGGGTIASNVTLSDALQISQNSSSAFIISGAISNATGNQNISVGGSGATTLSGNITTGTGNLTMNGTGTLTLAGSNTFTGGTTINNGVVAVSNDVNLGGITGGVTLNGGTLENTATMTLDPTRVVTVNANGGTFLADASTTLTYNGVLAGAGDIIKAGGGIFSTGGAGANTHSGDIAITAGTFVIAKSAAVSAIGNAAAVTISGGGTLRFNGTSGYVAETIGSLAGAGTVTNASANALALTTGDATSTLFSGAIQNTGGALSLTKTGTGTMTLTDTAGLSNFTGTTTVSQGVLNIQANTALGSTTGGTSVTAGAALEIQGNITVGAEALALNGTGETAGPGGALRNVSGNNSISGAITLGSNATIGSDEGTLTLTGAVGGATRNLTLDGAGNITMSGVVATTTGTLTKNGTGYATLSGNSTFTGATAINNGVLEIQNGNALGTSAGGVTVAAGATLALSGNITSAETPVTLNGVGYGSSGALRSLSGTNTLSGTSIVLASSSLVGVDTGTLTVSGVVSGAAGMNLTKVGTGTLVLSGANTYSGATAINEGTVQISSDARLGTAPAAATAGQLTFNGGTLATTTTMTLNTNRGVALATGGGTFDTLTGTTLTYGGVVAGTGNLTKTGAGTMVLTGANTYSGATNLNGGTLSINSDARLGTAPASPTSGQLSFNGGTLATTATMTLDSDRSISVNSGGGTIDVANASTLTFGGTIEGTGTLNLALNSTAILNLTSSNDFSSGTVFLSGGTLLLSGVDLSVGTFHITGNTILDFGNNVASSLTATNFIVDAGATVTVNNWINGSDYFLADHWWMNGSMSSEVPFNTRGSAPENQVVFSGYAGSATSWIPYDATNAQITPVPEPSTYGAIFLSICVGVLFWRRSKCSTIA